MRIIALASVRGAPGVTTASLLLAATLPTTAVLEADLDGGVLAVRYGLGREPGLTTLAASGDGTGDGWRAHAQDAGGVPVLVGPDAPSAAASLWRTGGERITRSIVAADGVAVVDAGRLRSPVPLVAAADLLLLLVNPMAEQLVALTHILPAMASTVRGQLGVVVVGEGPYRVADIEDGLGVAVLGVLPEDRGAAEALRSGGSRSQLSRSRLARAVGALGAEIVTSPSASTAAVAP